MLNLLFIVIVGAALAVGLWLNKRKRDRIFGDQETGTLTDLVGRALLVASLFMGFALASASASFGQARNSVRVEAETIDNFFEYSEYAEEPERRELTGGSVCYTRAVLNYGWGAGTGLRSDEINHWTSGFRDVFARMHADGDPLFGGLVSADDKRSDSRRARIEESRPNTPTMVYLLITVTVAISIGAFALTLPRRSRPIFTWAVIVLAGLFTLTMVAINDLEVPFTGVIQVSEYQMRDVLTDTTAEFAAEYGEAAVPCDEQGRPR
ncbi:MAG TPA: hypothetical protein VGF17_00260 [Phytomonospora sp.]